MRPFFDQWWVTICIPFYSRFSYLRKFLNANFKHLKNLLIFFPQSHDCFQPIFSLHCLFIVSSITETIFIQSGWSAFTLGPIKIQHPKLVQFSNFERQFQEIFRYDQMLIKIFLPTLPALYFDFINFIYIFFICSGSNFSCRLVKPY